jgi:hypothetical protein
MAGRIDVSKLVRLREQHASFRGEHLRLGQEARENAARAAQLRESGRRAAPAYYTPAPKVHMRSDGARAQAAADARHAALAVLGMTLPELEGLDLASLPEGVEPALIEEIISVERMALRARRGCDDMGSKARDARALLDSLERYMEAQR